MSIMERAEIMASKIRASLIKKYKENQVIVGIM